LAVAVPLPLVTEQDKPVGCVFTVTAYVPVTAVTNANVVAPLAMVRSSVALFCKINPDAVSPVRVPLIVYVAVPVPVDDTFVFRKKSPNKPTGGLLGTFGLQCCKMINKIAKRIIVILFVFMLESPLITNCIIGF
jgi:hypothetical protein